MAGASVKFDHLLTSGHTFSKEEYNTKLNYVLFNSMLLFNVLLLLIAIGLRLYEGSYLQALFDSVYVLVSLAVFMAARLSRAYFVVFFYLLVLISYLLITFTFSQGNTSIGGTGWYFILLITVVFIRGYREGVLFFLLSIVTIVCVSVMGNHTAVEISVGIMPFIVAYFFILLYEKRNSNFKEIVEEQRSHYAYRAQHDMLTGLPNREYFFERFEQMRREAKENGSKIAILFIDLDDFKKLNDELGHHIGDEMLVQVAIRLRSVLSKGDMIGRFGGDEFAILLQDSTGLVYTQKTIDAIFSVVKKPLIVQEHILFPTFSMGCSIFPDDGLTEIELLRKADAAMYRAKKDAHKKYYFFSSERVA